MENLKLQDDDLTFYSLVLLTNITKDAHDRIDVFQNQEGLADVLTDILRSSVSIASKKNILAETASVIGQLCVDNHIWSIFCRDGSQMVNILIDIHDEAELGSKVKSTTMFALRQICSKPKPLPHLTKEMLGQQLIPKVVAELKHVADKVQLNNEAHTFSTHCVANAVNLLRTLSVTKKNSECMAKEGLVATLQEMMASPLCHVDHNAPAGGALRHPLLSDITCEEIAHLWQTLHGRHAGAVGAEASSQSPKHRRSTDDVVRRSSIASTMSRGSKE